MGLANWWNCRLTLALASILSLLLASCAGSQHKPGDPQLAEIAAFDTIGHYTLIARKMNDGALSAMAQAYGREIDDGELAIDGLNRQAFIQGRLTRLSQAKEVILFRVRCSAASSHAECTSLEMWAYKERGKPRAGGASTNVKRVDKWEWDGSKWNLAKTTLSDEQIVN